MYAPTQHGKAVDPGATELRRDGAKVAPEELDCQNLAIQGPSSWGHVAPARGQLGDILGHVGSSRLLHDVIDPKLSKVHFAR